MKTRVYVTLKNGVLEPQGKAIHHALEGLGFNGVNDVRAGKLIVLDFAEGFSDADIVELCRKPAMVWHKEAELPGGTDLVGIPGGFSYGDYLRSGAMAARSPIMRAVKDAAARGVPVIGICNGFQVLTEAGLLPGALMRNAGLSFVNKAVRLRVVNSQSLFTAASAAGETVAFPVAHRDG